MSRRIWSVPILVAMLLPLVVVTAHGTAAESQTLYVTFHPSAPRITVMLASGAAVGTTSGAPTVILPGPYSLSFDDSAGATGPKFDLNGPGVSISEDMFYGEIQAASLAAMFQPSSTYTWRNEETPNVIFTFVTSAEGGTSGSGSSGGAGSSGSGSKTGTPAKSIVGSGVIPFRGKLAATVDAAGKLALTTKGKPVVSLKAGLYTFTIVDKSPKSGFAIQKLNASSTVLTGVGYKGTHVATINLKAGQWTFFSPGGKKNYFIVVA